MPTVTEGRWLTAPAAEAVDAVQQHALSEGFYVDTAEGTSPRLFSSEQARACLAGKSIAVSGDSYTKQLAIGLIEVLTGKLTNSVIRNARKRQRALEAALATAASDLTPRGINISFPCMKPCYGWSGRMLQCASCLKATGADLVILSTGIHLAEKWRSELSTHENATARSLLVAEQVLKETKLVFDSITNLIWGTSPSYNRQKIPEKYKDTMPLSDMEHFYHKTLRLAQDTGIRLADFHEMTRACVWDNCTADGGHRSRFVNRAKAQAVLALVCPDHTRLARP